MGLLKRKLGILLCVLLLSFSLLPVIAGASTGAIYFTAVNDRLLPLTSETMPMVSGGALYVPYTVFDANSTGINLGVSCSYSRTGNTLTIYNLRQMLVYDMDEDNSRNQHTGQTYSARAITRNGRIYVPLSFTCEFFGLSWTNSYTEYGSLIRVTSSSAVLSNSDFIDAGSVWMASRLKEYQASLNTGTSDPSPSPSPSPTPPSTDPGSGARVYFAFRCDDGVQLQDLLDILDSYHYHAVFFLSPELLEERDDLVRRIAGSGHGLGLLAQADTAAGAARQLEEGSLLLEHILHTRTYMAMADNAVAEELSQQGWLCWDSQVNGVPGETTRPSTLSANVVRSISRHNGSIHVTMDSSAVSVQALPSILRQLREDSYSIRLAVETDF